MRHPHQHAAFVDHRGTGQDFCQKHGFQPRAAGAGCAECEDERLRLLALQVGPVRFAEETQMFEFEEQLDGR